MIAGHRLATVALATVLAVLTGCATPQTKRLLASPPPAPGPVELAGVPFFPQQDYQCGPAALATVLNVAGVAVTPEQLAPQLYLPDRRGSLQPELLGTARRHERVPYVLRPQLEALIAEVAAGNPILVLQNLGLAVAPVWHYAVVIGFDLARAELVLRSGTDRRKVMRLHTFEHTWRRGGYWGVVVLPPDTLPQTAEELPYLKSVLALEQLEKWTGAAAAYGAALNRWPRSLGAQMGLGNSRYALGDLARAESAFRTAALHHPNAGAAFNNLAQVLADQGRIEEADRAARQAVETGGDHAGLFRRTLAEIQALRQEVPAP